MPTFAAVRLIVALVVSACLLSACTQEAEVVAPPAIPVKVFAVVQRDTALTKDLVGEVRGSQEVELRARVSGILTGKMFRDGARVNKGDLLFTIDPREYVAQTAAAKAQLAAAQASASRARLDVERYQPLVAERAISQQVYDNAVAIARETQAQVAALKAAVESAELGLEYAEVRAPFDGQIGVADIFEGGLVSAGQTVLATISNANPAWVYFSVSENDLLRVQRQMSERAQPTDAGLRTVTLTLGDGGEYPLPGVINFADRALDPQTGTYQLRAEFDNPHNLLAPGMFARIRVTGQSLGPVLLVPERAVIQQLGRYFVAVVGPGNVAVVKPIEPGPRVGAMWVVNSGLAAGERVVVEGTQKARPGTLLAPIEVSEDELTRSAQPVAGAPAQ
jgi:membrane fusion protein (multidrug efflux system)